MPDIAAMLPVYLIAGTQDFQHQTGNRRQALLDCLQTALESGITCFQLREKGRDALQNTEEIKALAQDCQQLCRQHHVPFFINDNVALALELAADGVHVGQEDMPIAEVIRLCNGRLLLGLSINTQAQAEQFNSLEGIDYFGIGPVFATQSKADAKAVVGTALIQTLRLSGIDKPLVAIGGITTANAAAVRAAGADGVAVISAVTQAADIPSAVNRLAGAGR